MRYSFLNTTVTAAPLLMQSWFLSAKWSRIFLSQAVTLNLLNVSSIRHFHLSWVGIIGTTGMFSLSFAVDPCPLSCGVRPPFDRNAIRFSSCPWFTLTHDCRLNFFFFCYSARPNTHATHEWIDHGNDTPPHIISRGPSKKTLDKSTNLGARLFYWFSAFLFMESVGLSSSPPSCPPPRCSSIIGSCLHALTMLLGSLFASSLSLSSTRLVHERMVNVSSGSHLSKLLRLPA